MKLESKTCSKCSIEKPLADFYKFKDKKRASCIICTKKDNKSRYSTEYNTIQCRKWVVANKERSRLIKRRHEQKLDCKLRMALRNRLYYALGRKMSDSSAVRHMGCTVAELKAFLEAKFTPGMTWENWTADGWHIDHIRPLASFNLTNSNEIKQAIHYTNLQPMWAKDNRVKGAKWKA